MRDRGSTLRWVMFGRSPYGRTSSTAAPASEPGAARLSGQRNYFSTGAIQVVVTVGVRSGVYNPGRSLRRVR